MTASAREYRRAKREELLNRYAQMGGMGATTMPMGGAGGAMPMGGGGSVAPSPLDGALGANADQGVSGLTGGEPTPEDAGTLDEEPTPGAKQPWGSICPQCGSADVDVANGEGNCRSCGAQLEYTFNVQVKPGNDEDKSAGKESEEMPPPEAPFGEDMGLGAATAPAPAPPAGGALGGGAGGGAPAPIMAQVSWLADSDVFVRLASPNYSKEKEKILPVGFICPSCGSRDVIKHKHLTYCTACPTISASSIRECAGDPTKVRVSISWLG
jgi:ssDNA-binding Zn-finger/Zn-ribbon topoisomerase 1